MIEPLRGWWYAGRAAVAPVRDALSEALKARLYEDPYQALHIAFPQDISRSREKWQEWVRLRVVVQEPVPSFYAYSQTFHKVGEVRGPFVRVGLIGLLPVEASVCPHEKTLEERESEIVEALRFLRVQATPVHMLAEADWGEVYPILREALVCPRLSVSSWDGVMHRIAPVQHRHTIQRLQQAFQTARFYIADGHHRWRGVRRAGLPYLLVFITDKADPTLSVPSAHRLLWSEGGVLERCEAYFDIQAAGNRVPLWREVVGLRHAVGVAAPNSRSWTLRLRPAYWELLNQKPLISWIHEWILDPLLEQGGKLEFGRDWGDLMRRARTEGAWLFAMSPIEISEVFRAADRQEPLPPKATYFSPKVLSGLIFYEEGLQNEQQNSRGDKSGT